MSKITKQDTNGVKPLLGIGELGYDNYPAGGDKGRVYVGTGTENISMAKKIEVTAVDTKVNTHTTRVDNPHGVTKAQVGLGNADNTSDANKPISTATQNALNNKVDTIAGKGLSTEDYTTTEKSKLAGIAVNANNYILPTATATVKGGVEIFSNTVQSVDANSVTTTAERTYGIQLNSAGQAVVNVPWTNTDTVTLVEDSLVSESVTSALSAAQGKILQDTKQGKNEAIVGTKEIRVAMPANNIDLLSGNLFTKTISAATTFTVSNIASIGQVNSFILELTNAGLDVITWWDGIKWAGGIAPVLTTSGVDILGFYSHDGGTTWRGILMAKDSK